MSGINDGGPAYPVNSNEQVWAGMTLRDYFAGVCMQKLDENGPRSMWNAHDFARESYRLADAMLEVRKQKT